MATIAGVAVAAAGVGMSAYNASQAGKKGGGGISVPTLSRPEKILNRQAQGIYGADIGVTEGGVGTQAMLTPELLRSLGYNVDYTDNTQSADYAAARDNATALQNEWNTNTARIAQIQGMKPKDRRAIHGGKEIQKLRKRMTELTSELPAAQALWGRMQSNPFTLKGITRDPNAPQNQLEQQQSEEQRLLGNRGLAALRGTLPDNPQLVRDWSLREETLKGNLASKLGPDWMLTTQGQMAMNDFQQQKNIAFETDRRNTIRDLLPEQSNLMSNSLGRTTSRQAASENIVQNILNSGTALSDLAKTGISLQQPYQSLRGAKTTAQAEKAQLDQQAAAQHQQAMAGLSSSLISAGGSLASSGGGGGLGGGGGGNPGSTSTPYYIAGPGQAYDVNTYPRDFSSSTYGY